MSKKYIAFISYSSSDQIIAANLVKKLESYVFPKELRADLSIPLERGQFLRPIFRDRDELAANGLLGAVLKSALEASNSLVVLCSPSAASSKWVNMEIEEFIRLGRAERIVALIVAGSPGCGEPGIECLPPALAGEFEPIAADLRPTGDGKERAFLKVVAGIAGVNFDLLYGRHFRNQLIKLISITIASLLGVLVLTGLLLISLDQRKTAIMERDHAIESRRIADDSILKILTQLRDQLESSGESAALELASIAYTAKDYYDNLPEDVYADHGTTRGRAVVLDALGEIERERGMYKSAAEKHSEAISLFSRIIEEGSPDEPLAISDLALANFKFGLAQLNTNKAAAVVSFREAEDLMGRAIAAAPKNLSFAHGRLLVLQMLSQTLLDLERIEDAMNDISAGAVILQELKETPQANVSRSLAMRIISADVMHDYLLARAISFKDLSEAEKRYSDVMKKCLSLEPGQVSTGVLSLLCLSSYYLATSQSEGGHKEVALANTNAPYETLKSSVGTSVNYELWKIFFDLSKLRCDLLRDIGNYDAFERESMDLRQTCDRWCDMVPWTVWQRRRADAIRNQEVAQFLIASVAETGVSDLISRGVSFKEELISELRMIIANSDSTERDHLDLAIELKAYSIYQTMNGDTSGANLSLEEAVRIVDRFSGSPEAAAAREFISE